MIIPISSKDAEVLRSSELTTRVNEVFQTLGLEPLVPDDFGHNGLNQSVEITRDEHQLTIGATTYKVSDQGGDNLALPKWLSPLLERFARQSLRSLKKLSSSGQARMDRHILREVLKALATRPQEDISLRNLAGACHRTPGYLGTNFQTFTGFSFRELLSIIRVKLVWDGLCKGSVMASEQGFESGFGSVSQLNRSFKRITGVTPSTVQPLVH